MRRTAGDKGVAGVEDSGRPRSTPAAAAFFSSAGFCSGSGSFFFSSSSFFFSGGLSVFLPSGTFFSSGGCFESSIVATTSPIFTSWPSDTLVSSTPDFSATISVETLSVSSAKSGSPSFTNSPDFLCQAETTPLVMDSPTAGIFTSMAMRGDYPASAGLIERRGRSAFRQHVPMGSYGTDATQMQPLKPKARSAPESKIAHCQSQSCCLLIDSAAQNDCAPRSCYPRTRKRKPYSCGWVCVKHRRNLSRTQHLGCEDDLPHSRSPNALTQGWFRGVDKRIWNHRLKRSAFCLINKRAVRAGDNKIDFRLTEITQDSLQNLVRFRALREISARMHRFDCERAIPSEHYCSRAFA